MIRKLIAIAAGTSVLALAVPAAADTYVRGYFRSDGTYVQGHYRSDPNGTTSDNYGTKGNVNPYTGERGTREPTYEPYRPRTSPPPVYTPRSYTPPPAYTPPCYFNCRR